MEKKEFHHANLPHFQQPGQAYFVTWNLQDAIPAKALKDYTDKLKQMRISIDFAVKSADITLEQIKALRYDYNILRKKMMKANEDLLHLKNKCTVNLSKTENTIVVQNALCYWEGKKLKNYAICVMPNHVHWVFQLFEKDEKSKPVWLDDVLKSVKQYSSTQINLLELQKGTLWHKESWDTTIRDHRHLYEAIEYTRKNPVVAGLVKDWKDWKGTLIFE
jgi:REP element-mobilizing transposase RayT